MLMKPKAKYNREQRVVFRSIFPMMRSDTETNSKPIIVIIRSSNQELINPACRDGRHTLSPKFYVNLISGGVAKLFRVIFFGLGFDSLVKLKVFLEMTAMLQVT